MSGRSVLFPLFLKLQGCSCLVVGGNSEVEGKISNLLACGARVTVVSLIVTSGIRQLADENRIQWEARAFVPADLENVTLVVALDADDSVNEHIYKEASTRGVLCNVVDQPERCHFYYPAVVKRGHLQIAISTGGLSPALASQIRRDLDRQLDAEYASWVDALGDARERILRKHQRSPGRTRLLQRIASKRAFQQFKGARRKDRGESL